jgi:lipoyl-dependent peroxiredoxin
LLAYEVFLKLPAGPSIDAEIDLNNDDDGFFPRARLNVSMARLNREVAQELLQAEAEKP